MFKKKKVRQELAPASNCEAVSLFQEEIPVHNEGYSNEESAIVYLVSNKKAKSPYQVKGIEDTASKNNWKAWLYLAPVVVLVTVFLLYPLINTIFIAFTQNYNYSTGAFEGLTFNNFGVILGLTKTSSGALVTDFVKYAIPNTMFITFVTVPIATALALLISVGLNSIKWFQKVLQTVFFLPYVTNAIAVGMVFSVLFKDTGVINFIFNLGKKEWLTTNAGQWTAMVPLCIYIIWQALPFKILIFLSGLQGIDKQYYQAAHVDAAGKTKTFFRITVPLLSPQILYILVTSFIAAFKEYTAVVGLFDGHPGTSVTEKNMLTIVYYIYENLSSNTSIAAAAAVFLFVIIMVFTFIQMGISRKRVYY